MVIAYTGWFIGFCFLIFLVVWAIMAFNTKRTLERGGWGWRIAILGVAAVLILLQRIDFLGVIAGGRLWDQTLVSGLVADVITLIGLGNLLWARVTLGGNWSSDPVIKVNQELIESGPYQWMRHPIYSSLLVMILGIAIWSGHFYGFAILIAVLLGLWLKLRQEEQLLTKYFPEEYPRYKARVKALIPFVL